MSNELRAAAERWRQHKSRKDEASSPYYAGTFNQNDDAQMLLARDLRVLADAYLAEHPEGAMKEVTQFQAFTDDQIAHIASEVSHDMREGLGERIRWNNRAMLMALNSIERLRTENARLKTERRRQGEHSPEERVKDHNAGDSDNMSGPVGHKA